MMPSQSRQQACLDLWHISNFCPHVRILVCSLNAVEDIASLRVVAVHLGVLQDKRMIQERARVWTCVKKGVAVAVDERVDTQVRWEWKRCTDTHQHLVLLAGFANLPGQMSDHENAGDASQDHIAVFLGKYNHLGSRCTRECRGEGKKRQKNNETKQRLRQEEVTFVLNKTSIKQSSHLKYIRKSFYREHWWLQTTAQ